MVIVPSPLPPLLELLLFDELLEFELLVLELLLELVEELLLLLVLVLPPGDPPPLPPPPPQARREPVKARVTNV